jgi:hypothetical protein
MRNYYIQTYNMFKPASNIALPVNVAAGGYFTLSPLRHGMVEAYFTPEGTLTVVT